MREYSVLLPLGRIEVGVPIDRSAWPLHVTIQSNVRTAADPDDVVAAVRDAAAALGPVAGVVTEEAHFGPDGSVLVDRVESADFRRAHDAVHATLRLRTDAISVTPAADGDGYQPHVTVTSRGRARRGDRLELRTVVLVEVGPGGDRGIALPLASFELSTRQGAPAGEEEDPDVTGILLISGSTRSASTNTAVLRSAAGLAPRTVRTELYEGLARLPAFDPDVDHAPLPPEVADLRERIGTADAILFSTPEYAGALPGSFKNLLDWTVGGNEIQGKPVAWINVSSVAAPTQGADAHASLEKVLGYVGADLVRSACQRAPMTRSAVTADGRASDPDVLDRLQAALAALHDHALGQQEGDGRPAHR